jgi:YegS/Rv2252/BmrU family lipid kinase
MRVNDPKPNTEATSTHLNYQLEPTPPLKNVHIIVNPASGQTGLNLPELNKVMQELEIDWEMFVTSKGGQAGERAAQSIAAGVDAIAVYGGDGTVLEVASQMSGTNIPLVILPGGTANVLSMELGIPRDQREASLLMGGDATVVRPLDMGVLVGGKPDGSDLMFFHLGIGLEGVLHDEADRDAKDRSGMFAYFTAALKSLTNPTSTHFRIMIDGQMIEADGINLMITNFGSVGVPGIKLSHAVDVSDGVLDIINIKDANFGSLLTAAANAVTSGELAQALEHWQGKEVIVEADPPQKLAIDGELIDAEKIHVKILPQAVRVVVPAPQE